MKNLKITEDQLKNLLEAINEQPTKENDWYQEPNKDRKVNAFTDRIFPKLLEIAEVHGNEIAWGVIEKLESRLRDHLIER
jgi:hypothetical protein